MRDNKMPEHADQHDTNSDTNTNQGDPKTSRRTLLKAISAAGVVGAAKLPEQWGRPVVDHVLLPAHAAGSPEFLCALTCTIERAFAVAITRSSDSTINGDTTYPITVCYFVTVGATCSRQTDGAVFGTNVSSQITDVVYASTDPEHSFFMTYFPSSPTYSLTQPSGFDFNTVFSSAVTTGTQCDQDLSEFVSTGIVNIPSSGPIDPP